MSGLPVNKYFVLNEELQGVKLFASGDNEGGIYEVLRVVDGVPLFLEEHFERFYNSAKLAGISVPFTETQITKLLKDLIAKNKVSKGNILVSFKINLKAFFIAHNYPTQEMLDTGVVCGILKAERDNPNAKVFHTTVRFRADQILAEKGFFEVLLLDHLGKVTEGSRSNLFFVGENEIVTSPANKVLLGITRQKTIRLAEELNIPVIEREVNFSELKAFKSAFITGTSPKILPVQKIDAFKFDPQNEIVRQLMKSYDDLIEEYIKQAKSE